MDAATITTTTTSEKKKRKVEDIDSIPNNNLKPLKIKHTPISKPNTAINPTKPSRAPNNLRMHPQNPFKSSAPNFALLAEKYPLFKPHVKFNSHGNPKIDFTDPQALRELTKAILHDTYGLTVDLPSDRLCPTVTLRVNYVYWISDLINSTNSTSSTSITFNTNTESTNPSNIINTSTVNNSTPSLDQIQNEGDKQICTTQTTVTQDNTEIDSTNTSSSIEQNSSDKVKELTNSHDNNSNNNNENNNENNNNNTIDISYPISSSSSSSQRIRRGIDIGTGSSCIYPLLGCKIYGWNFLGTEIDTYSLSYAQRNIDANNSTANIRVRLVPSMEMEPRKILLDVITKEDGHFDFCMCNPPFFSDVNQTKQSDKTICTGADVEMVTEGGELSFISQIIKESLVLRDQIGVYTSMVGRKINLDRIVSELKTNGISHFQTTEFYQGKQTRWAVAWSFDPLPN